jgi:hypothetical protein
MALQCKIKFEMQFLYLKIFPKNQSNYPYKMPFVQKNKFSVTTFSKKRLLYIQHQKNQDFKKNKIKKS